MKWKMPSKLRLWVTGAVLTIGLLLLILSTWVVPWVIEGQVHSFYNGKVRIAGWWANRSSAGVQTLLLYEGESASSEVWARVERVETDLTLGRLIFGNRSPSRVTLIRPALTFRIDKDGKPLTVPPFQGGGSGKSSSSPLPRIVVEDATITLQQVGGAEMVITGVSGQLFGQDGKQVVDFGVDDSTWGKWSASGKLGGDFQSGQVVLRSLAPVDVTAEKTARLPFVPAVVWKNVSPRGPVGVELAISPGKDLHVVTNLRFEKADVALPDLGLRAADTEGRVVVADNLVKLQGLHGQALDGKLGIDGTLDFTRNPPRFDLDLKLDKIDVTRAPPSWQLNEAGVTGRLTGAAKLKIAIKPEGADLTGSEGDAVVEGKLLGGTEVIKLSMRGGQASDLQYTVKGAAGASLPSAPKALAVTVIGLQEPARPKAGGLTLPRFINAEIDLTDVDLVQVVAKAQALGIRIPVPMSGKLSIKASARIPLGTLREIKSYTFHGQATLKSAVIDGVDLGLLRARLDLENGVLDLSDFQGRLFDRPAGSRENPAPAAEPIAPDAPLPSGGFRGRLHAAIDPPGRLEGHFEGNSLPVGELAAPFFPRPTPVSGLLSLEVAANVDMSKLGDPNGWDVSGKVNGSRISYRGSVLNAIAATFAIKQAHLDIPDLAASLEGQPLNGSVSAGLAAPYAFQARLNTTDWDLGALLSLVPPVPKPAPVAGKITVHASARGTLSPQEITSEGEGEIRNFLGGPIPLGNVPIRWATRGDAIVVSGVEAQPFGGKILAKANIPVKGDRPITASLQVRNVDTGMLSAAVPNGALQLAGKADGDASLTIRPLAGGKAPVVEASLKLNSPDLTIQGLAAREIQAVVKVLDGSLRFDLFAESLGGKIKFTGDIPLGAADGPHAPEANATLQAIGFRIEDLWRPLGIHGGPTSLQGLGAIDVNLRTHRDTLDVRAPGDRRVPRPEMGPACPHGGFEGDLRDLARRRGDFSAHRRPLRRDVEGDDPGDHAEAPPDRV